MILNRTQSNKIYHGPTRLSTICIIFAFLIVVSGCRSSSEREWVQEDGYRWAELNPEGESAGFKSLTSASTGITFRNILREENIVENQNLLNGSGVTAGDVDGDGWSDLYFTALDGPNKLYRNLGGMEFEDITEEAGVAHENVNSTGAVLADIDGDGNLDILVSAISKPNLLYLNDGNGKFSLKQDSGLQKAKGSMTMALSDIEGDGDLDLYITNYKERQAKDIFDLRELSLENITQRVDDGFEIRPPYDEHFALLQDEDGYNQRELGEKDELYINQGDGTFEMVENPEKRFFDSDGNPQGLDLDWGLAARFADMNGDGLQDLYVCNDYWSPDRVWLNQGDGTFREMDELAIRNFSFYSMAIDFSDVNNDGAQDFFVTEMLAETHQERMRQLVPNDPTYNRRTEDQPQYNRNSFYLNRKDTTFAELTYYAGLESTNWSWATKFMDVDLDGYEDLIVNNGFSYDMQDLDAQNRLSQEVISRDEPMKDYVLRFPRLEHVNKVFRNSGDLKFEDKSSDWGFTESDISHGLATADFDRDGDLDVAINRLNDEARIYENRAGAGRVAVRLIGEQPNTQAIGAKVYLIGDEMEQMREISSGGDYLSGSDPLIVFAAPQVDANYILQIVWPDGSQTDLEPIEANRIYEIDQASVAATNPSQETIDQRDPMFENVSDRIDHRHTENEFEEGQMQDLLPRQLSTLGPGLSWIDYDSDGDEDLFIGASRGNEPGIFENEGDGSFQQVTLEEMSDQASGDQTSIIGWNTESGLHLLMGQSNYEQGSSEFPSALHWSSLSTNSPTVSEIPGISSATGPIAAADYDGDSDVDLFVGGRVIRSFYPRNATSRLFLSDEGSFRLDDENADLLNDIGMITGAVFTDYDMDGDQDLLLSRAWGSLVILQNNEGQFSDVSEQVGLNKYSGWWNGVSTGDFNNDGRPDIVATNWGVNSFYQMESSNPMKIFHGDFDRDNRYEIVEAYFDKNIGEYVPRRRLDQLAEPLPPVTRFIQTYRDYADASLEEIFRTDLSNIPSKEINTLQSMVFINTEDGYRAEALPDEAQFTTAQDAVIADYDNDGNEDLFLSQNLFDVPLLIPRQDAGRGLLLRGKGDGTFEPVSANESGIKVYGQQKGSAAADFNRDGKTDLAVSQNDDSTRLFVNQSNKSGVRIQLVGPPENMSAVGSSIRMVYPSGEKGPRREIQAGSGYGSQNGFIQVMGYHDDFSKAVEITWFNGDKQMIEISEGKAEYIIQYQED
ncbi:MAG: hypothetical protein GVY07_08230 [Bacteroidetes bacterium]|jgi:hypothetical protein|nr:hypothetical protein [Bacteroidota bacterium]